MPGFEPHSGEGAISTGPMVVVHDARSVGEARAVVELLEANAIPALVNLEIEGILFPWQEPRDSGTARVLVPSMLLSSARDVLKRASTSGTPLRVPPPSTRPGPRGRGKDSDAPAAKPRGPFRGPGPDSASRSRPPDPPAEPGAARTGEGAGGSAPPTDPVFDAPRRPIFARELPRVFEIPPTPEVELHEEETGPIDLELPEPSPLAPRLLVAMLAIAFGIGLQRTLEIAFGFGARGTLERFAASELLLGEPWRLITAGFLHMGPEHFISNGAFGLLLGVVLFGTHHFGATAFVWVAGSMIGLLAEVSLSGAGALIAGASAGNYALVGVWAKGQLDRAHLSLLSRRERLRTIGILLLLVPGALTPITSSGSRVAVVAHVIGFLTGAVLGYVFERRLAPQRFELIARRSRIAGACALVLAAAGIILGVLANPAGK